MIFGNPATWPVELMAYLERNHEWLLAHDRYDSDVLERYSESGLHGPSMCEIPSNPYFRQYLEAAQNVRDIIQPVDLLGWHCTRLVEREVLEIESKGMQLPDLQFLQERIARLCADGWLEDECAQRLLQRNEAHDAGREKRICFTFDHSCLSVHSNFERLFRSWDGEALYISHENDELTGPILKAIGQPCIVEANVPVAFLKPLSALGENVISRYLRSTRCAAGEAIGHDDDSLFPIPANKIVRVIRRNDPDFSVLTGCDKWDKPL